MQGIPTGGDAWGMYLVTKNVADNGSVFLPPSDMVVLRTGRDGRPVSKYGIGQSLAEAPAYIIARAVAERSRNIDPETAAYFVTSFTSPVVCALLCTVVFLFCLQLGYGAGAACIIAMFTGAGSMIWPQSKTLFSEPFQALCLTAGFYHLLLFKEKQKTNPMNACAAGFFLGMMTATKPFLAFILIPLISYFLISMVKGGWKRPGATASAVLFFGALAAWGALILYYNYLRFGDVMQFGYLGGTDRDGIYAFKTPLLIGIHGLLLSPGKGLIYYSPILILSIAAYKNFAVRHRAEAIVIAAVAVIIVLAYSKWNAWHGDFSWGPRFLSPVVPLLLLVASGLFEPGGIAAKAWGKLLIAVFFAVSFFVQILGVTVNYNEYIIMTKSDAPYDIFDVSNKIDLRDDLLNVHYIPEFSPLTGHYWAFKKMIAERISREKRQGAAQDGSPWNSLIMHAVPKNTARLFGIDTWWRYLSGFYPETRVWVYPLAWVIAVLLLISGVSVAVSLYFIRKPEEGTNGPAAS